MLLALALTALTAIIVAFVVLPLLRGGRPAPERSQFDRAVYRDQLRELQRDEARGLIAPAEAASARIEIERRLLAAADEGTAPNPARSAPSPLLAVALAVLLPGASVLLYLALGAPGVPDQPYAARAPERALAARGGHADLAKTVAALEAKLKQAPESDADWLLLAQSEAALGDWQKSADAYREAMRLTEQRPDIAASYGEMLVMAAGGIVTPRAREAFEAALARDGANAVARYYLALGDAQEGKAEAAIAAWQKLAAEQAADSPVRAELSQRIEETARAAGLPAPALAPPQAGPSAAQMAAAANMPAEEREKMIRGMVAGLAAKLAGSPDDVDGWLRLGRAYAVLGERDKAADAYEHAARLRPEDARIPLAEAEALLPDRRPETPVPARAVQLLKRADALDPRQPTALWYLGLAAAQQRDFAAADGYWQRLLALLPPDTDQRRAVAAALEALKRK
jgi:cytochrome c-type biogenesis protein CcmH